MKRFGSCLYRNYNYTLSKRYVSMSKEFEIKSEILAYQNNLFDKEQKRQREAVGRIEKITVNYNGPPENVVLSMNKGISTPYHCAKHISEMLIKRSGLALIDGIHLWDMHRPLESDCEINFMHAQYLPDPYHFNRAYWRSCSLILGAVITKAFREDILPTLHSFPSPNVKSGSFVYDVELSNLPEWSPSDNELRILSANMVKLAQKSYQFDRLPVSEELALDIFQDNKFKKEQIPNIVQQSVDKKVILYRIGDHIDISRGPMLGNTDLLGRCTIAAVHRLETKDGNLYRFQGVSLPKNIMLNHFAYSILEQRAKKINAARLPDQYLNDLNDTFVPQFVAEETIA
ncbi:Beta-grasp domain,Threonyl/alanyl tRNA synthetase, class II-like, putative editing domain,TGS [Cinara cedri]|uniref:Large ribosomal subunit protein mL39 n=1 Tax=Cinara cedri TaxID=506608 RepID=A0A5E4NBL6_9HEMI|nr:Beta-grasp domain,Threonyl/alanyl tRNA synthetase, class II-like, putative editing domain,TGS [Cinara cedri]